MQHGAGFLLPGLPLPIGMRRRAVAAAGLTATWRGSASDLTSQTTYSFASQPFGTADSERRVIVGIAGRPNSPTVVSSVTIGGVAAVRAGARTTGAVAAEVWFANVPTGTTGTVDVTWTNGQTSCVIGIWTTIGAIAIYGFDSAVMGSAADSSNVTIDTSSSGFVVACGQANDVGTVSAVARGMTQDDMVATGSSSTQSAFAHAATGSSSAVVGFDGDGTSPNGNSPYIAVAFGPQPGSGILDGLSPTFAVSLSRNLLGTYAADKYTLTSGAISAIHNQVSPGDSVTDGGTSTKRPALSTAGPNSIACADFDGSSDMLVGATITNYVTNTNKFIVWSGIFDSITVNTSVSAVGHLAVGDANTRIAIAGFDASGDKAFASNYDGSFDEVGQTVTEGAAVVVTLRGDGTNVYVSVNGAAETSVATGATTGATALQFGKNDFSAYFDGKMFECAMFSTVPSSGDRTAIVADFMSHVGAV